MLSLPNQAYLSDWAKKIFRWLEAGWIGIVSRLLFSFVKRKTVSSNERKGIGRGEEVWEAKKEVEQEKEKKKKKKLKGNIKVKKKWKKYMKIFSPKLVRVI